MSSNASSSKDGSSESMASDGVGSSPPQHTLHLPTPEDMQMQEIMNMCPVRAVLSGAMGGVSGLFMGMMFGALEQPLHSEEMTTRQILVHGAKTMGARSMQMGKTFAIMGTIFSATECFVEKARAKHDMTNPLIAGCITGGALSAKAGFQAACFGCAGFAAFTAAIEHFLSSRD